VDVDEDNVDLTVPAGATEELRLPSLGTAGYEWSFQVDDDRTIRVTKAVRESKPAEQRPPGESVDEVFAVEALRPGTAQILFELARPWRQQEVVRRIRVTVRSEPAH